MASASIIFFWGMLSRLVKLLFTYSISVSFQSLLTQFVISSFQSREHSIRRYIYLSWKVTILKKQRAVTQNLLLGYSMCYVSYGIGSLILLVSWSLACREGLLQVFSFGSIYIHLVRLIVICIPNAYFHWPPTEQGLAKQVGGKRGFWRLQAGKRPNMMSASPFSKGF